MIDVLTLLGIRDEVMLHLCLDLDHLIINFLRRGVPSVGTRRGPIFAALALDAAQEVPG